MHQGTKPRLQGNVPTSVPAILVGAALLLEGSAAALLQENIAAANRIFDVHISWVGSAERVAVGAAAVRVGSWCGAAAGSSAVGASQFRGWCCR